VPLESVIEIAELLSKLRFDLPLLSSERYVLETLSNLKPEEIEELRRLFSKNKHPRFKKEFTAGRHKPFGKTSDYLEAVENADLTKLAKLIKLVGMLMQEKVYLFGLDPGFLPELRK
jgi:hypothetical protein